jgi:hypothetical protein
LSSLEKPHAPTPDAPNSRWNGKKALRFDPSGPAPGGEMINPYVRAGQSRGRACTQGKLNCAMDSM